ncbi:MAG: hypothetical protein ACJ747_13855 [Gaiellaceae bacterium]|jgi:hypothetical protein
MWRRAIAGIGLAAVLAAPAAAVGGKAQLRLVASSPLRIQGLRFHPGERVRATLVSPVRRVRQVTVTRGGTFAADFGVARDRCSGVFVTAVGASGDRAAVRALPQCPPP